jgi:hypothetical protein
MNPWLADWVGGTIRCSATTTATVIEDMMKNGSCSPDLVANVVLNAVTNENPNLRYLAGKDVETWLDGKRNMSDEEFYKMMQQNLMKGIIELDSK